MSFIIVGIAAAAGVAKIAVAMSGRKKRIREQKAAMREMQNRKRDYEAMQFTNPYADMENTMEDLTVNTQQAEFQKQQIQQQQAATLRGMQGAAGGSGIAGLAQAMANQGALAAQRASASIGMQEQRNQMAAAQEQGRLDTLEAQGVMRQENLQRSKTETLLGMSQQRKAAADAARARAKQQVMSGIGTIGSAGVMAGQAYNAKEAQTDPGGTANAFWKKD